MLTFVAFEFKLSVILPIEIHRGEIHLNGVTTKYHQLFFTEGFDLYMFLKNTIAH